MVVYIECVLNFQNTMLSLATKIGKIFLLLMYKHAKVGQLVTLAQIVKVGEK
jgi:hypothetical protein